MYNIDRFSSFTKKSRTKQNQPPPLKIQHIKKRVKYFKNSLLRFKQILKRNLLLYNEKKEKFK